VDRQIKKINRSPTRAHRSKTATETPTGLVARSALLSSALPKSPTPAAMHRRKKNASNATSIQPEFLYLHALKKYTPVWNKLK
jgi:hypothetical protein